MRRAFRDFLAAAVRAVVNPEPPFWCIASFERRPVGMDVLISNLGTNKVHPVKGDLIIYLFLDSMGATVSSDTRWRVQSYGDLDGVPKVWCVDEQGFRSSFLIPNLRQHSKYKRIWFFIG